MPAIDLDAAFHDALATIERHEVAGSTAERYTAEWATFVTWCDRHGVGALPASPVVVQAYFLALTGASCDDDGTGLRLLHRANRIDVPWAAIRLAHRRAGYETPTKDAGVRALAQLLRRADQPGARKARALALALLEDIARNPVGRMWDRDLTAMTLGYFGAFRGGELIAVRTELLSFRSAGLVVGIPRSKGDPLGYGQYVAIAARPDRELCPVRQVRHWLEVSGITDGWLFPSPRRSRSGRHLSLGTLQRSMQRAIAGSVDDVSGYTTHSLRRGFATSAAEAGNSILSIAQKMRQRNLTTTIGYVDDAMPGTAATLVVDALGSL